MSPLLFTISIVGASVLIAFTLDQWVKRWYEDKEKSNA